MAGSKERKEFATTEEAFQYLANRIDALESTAKTQAYLIKLLFHGLVTCADADANSVAQAIRDFPYPETVHDQAMVYLEALANNVEEVHLLNETSNASSAPHLTIVSSKSDDGDLPEG